MLSNIAIASQRNGVGKTTTAVVLARLLAANGPHVLLIDLDPKGHVAHALELAPSPALYRWLVEGESPSSVIVLGVRPRLSVILGNRQTEAIKKDVANLDLKARLNKDFTSFEELITGTTVFDLPTPFDDVQKAALQASDWVIIPSRLDAFAVTVVNKTLSAITGIPQASHLLNHYSILPTFFDPSTQESQTQLLALNQAFPGKVLPFIPLDLNVNEVKTSIPSEFRRPPLSPALIGYDTDGKRTGGYEAGLFQLFNIIDKIIDEKAENFNRSIDKGKEKT